MNRLRTLMQDPRLRIPLFAAAMLALLWALWAGLIRMGWGFPPLVQGVAALHGPLMVCGFLGTVISLERAVAIGQRWAYAAPLFCAAGGIVLLMPGAAFVGALLLTLGSLGMVAIFYVIVRRQPALFTYTMALGACAWCLGNVVWVAGLPLATVTLWWVAFLVLTIVGERLELSRLLRLPRSSEQLFLGAVGVFLGGILWATVESRLFPEEAWFIGSRATGLGMVALAIWLLRYDIARRTVRQSGLTRYMAWCLLTGYVWLGVGGVLQMIYAGATAGPLYDAMLHAVFVGFVFSMIFAHMPIILPAVLRRAVAYSRWMYAPLLLLNISLALRLGGDLYLGLTVRQWGGILNATAILLFLGLTAYGLAVSGHGPKRKPAAPQPLREPSPARQ